MAQCTKPGLLSLIASAIGVGATMSLAAGLASADPVSINFNALTPGDTLTNQYSATGATFSLIPSPTEPGSPLPPPTGPTVWSLGSVDQFGVNANSIIVGPTTNGPFYDAKVVFDRPLDYFSIVALDAETSGLRVIAYSGETTVPLTVRSTFLGTISALPYVSGPTYLLEIGAIGGLLPTFDRVVFGGTEQFDNLTFSATSSTGPKLDQINEVIAGSGPEARAGRILAQTFTVGVTGTLAYVDMWLWDSGRPATADLFVEIWPTHDGLPQSGALAQVIFTPNDVQDQNSRVYTRADFTGAGLSVTQGDVLSIVLRSEASADPGGYDWWGNSEASDGVYLRGNGFHSLDGGVTWEQIAAPDWDYMFRTYVQVTPEALLADLLKQVTGVGAGKVLANKVKLAQTYYAARDIPATCAVMSDFVTSVQQFASGRKPKLSTALAAKLVADAEKIMTAIGCN